MFDDSEYDKTEEGDSMDADSSTQKDDVNDDRTIVNDETIIANAVNAVVDTDTTAPCDIQNIESADNEILSSKDEGIENSIESVSASPPQETDFKDNFENNLDTLTPPNIPEDLSNSSNNIITIEKEAGEIQSMHTSTDADGGDVCPSASRCKIYSRENKILKRYYRPYEDSLTIRDVSNLMMPYKCREDCDFISTSLSSLKIHSLLKHAGEECYCCTLCSQRFVCDDSLLEHICIDHYGQHRIMFTCNIDECFQSFPRIEALRRHLLTMHNNCKSIPCSFCFDEAYSANVMINHINSHLRRTMRCAYCFVIFNSKDEVIQHINSSHQGLIRKINLHVEVINHDRNLKDRYPKKDSNSAQTGNLQQCREEDIVISPATKPLPYRCQDCSFTCNSECTMSIHIKEGHSDNADFTKDFSCCFCKFSTNEKETISDHLLFHTNVKSLRCYTCLYCPKQSNSIDIIESHLSTKHPSESFKFEAAQVIIDYLQDSIVCPFCREVFKWKNSFCSHLSADHNLKNLADYLQFHCIFDASKADLVLSRQFLIDELKVALPASLFVTHSSDGSSRNPSNDEFLFKCIKCNFTNSSYNAYNEHVKKHYKSPVAEANVKVASPVKNENSMLFVCQLCPFQCNKSLNFKRHSAIHERAKGLENCFKCGYCQFRHDRINCIKFHLGKYHERLPIKVMRVANGEETDVTELEMNSSNNSNSADREEGPAATKISKEGVVKIPNEYFDSILPRGMIFAEPVKCPNCDYANRVRVNLMRHMRQHLYEDQIQIPKGKIVATQQTCGKGKGEGLGSPTGSGTHPREAANGEFFPVGSDPASQHFTDGVTTKKLFKCAYCDVVSKWNRRDISLHILHVHLQKKVYTCSYCEYGSRKSSQMVINHCARVHPGKPVAIKDELALFNSVVPLRDGDGVIPVAYVKKNGTPILDLSELGAHLKVNVRSNKNDINSSSNADNEEKSAGCAEDDKAEVEDGFSHDVDEEDFPGNVDNSEEWKCMFCGLQMFSESMMKRHVMCQHLKLKPYSCKYCAAQYWQRQSVENHVRSNHPDEEVCCVENVKEKMAVLSKYMQKITNFYRIRQMNNKKYSSIYQCRICGYQDPRHDKAKYHVVKKHLKIGLYSCSVCHQYMGGKGCVENHIQEFHPDSEAYVCRSYDVHALFLQKNIKKIGNFHSQLNKGSVQRGMLNGGSRKNVFRIKVEPDSADKPAHSKTLLTCSHCNYVAESEASLGAHSRVHKLFACFYCNYQNNLVSRVQSHCLIKHPTKPIKHRQIAPSAPSGSGGRAVPEEVNSISSEDRPSCDEKPDDVDQQVADLSEGSKMDTSNSFSSSDHSTERSAATRPGMEHVYKCKLCSYKSDKATVLRHHIMSHLLYHPYQCPYCNLVCSVKSSPITKHIQLKHPDKEIRFICTRDEQMEKQVRNSFEKISFDDDGNVTGVESEANVPAVKDEQHFAANQRVYYKCCFCSLVTPIRTDMKHHLMRELKYKPFSCAYCQYEEPCRSKMGKHFRIKHPGMTISIKHSVNSKQEAQIFEFLQKCMVRNSLKKSEQFLSQDKSSHIPIIRISNLQNVLISSLHYRGKFHKCSQCPFKTSSIRVFISHKSLHQKFKLKCSYCQYNNENIFLLRKHIKKCSRRNFVAPRKVRKIKSEWLRSVRRRASCIAANVKQALKTKHSEEWTCCYCSGRFPSPYLLREHVRKFHSFAPGSAVSAGRLSSRDSGALSGAEASSEEGPIVFCCNRCHYKFPAMEQLSRHLLVHNAAKVAFPALEVFPGGAGSRRHRCGFCPFETFLEEEFNSHVMTHTALHPIKCKYCLYASFTSSDMKNHFETSHPNQDVRFDSLAQPYTMLAHSNHKLPNFKPVVKLVDLRFCLS